MLMLIARYVGFGDPTYAATVYVDASVNRHFDVWSVGGLPAQPSAEWRLASSDGIDYDTLGSTGYRNYGSTSLTTSLTDGNRPSLTEGLLQPHQGALAFNGSTNYLFIDDATALDPSNQSYSIAAWVRHPTGAGSDQIVSKNQAAGDWPGFFFSTDGNGLVNMQVTTTLANSMTATSVGSIENSRWSFVCGVYRYQALLDDTAECYIDGVMDGQAVLSIGQTTNTGTFRIGNYAAADYWEGEIAWVAIWDGTALTPTHIAALYSAMKPTGAVGLPYPTLQSAVYQASAGDTILVNPGRYQETVTIATAFDYIGAVASTFGDMPEFYGKDLPSAAGTVGFTVSADNEVGFVTFRGYTSAQGLLGTATSDGSLFHHLEFDSCLNAVDFDGMASGDSLVNCIIDGASLASATGFRATTSSAVTVVVENCIIVSTVTALTKAAAQTLTEDHNLFFGNGTNYASSLDGTDLIGDPTFRGGNDYRLLPFSPALNNGLVIHSAVTPFSYWQPGPERGVWEYQKQLASYGEKGPWARERRGR